MSNFEGEKLNLIVCRVLCGWMVQAFRTVHRTDLTVADELMVQTACNKQESGKYRRKKIISAHKPDCWTTCNSIAG